MKRMRHSSGWTILLLVTFVVGMDLRGDNIDTEKLSPPASSQEGVLAYTYPTRVYKTRDAGNVKLESWYFYLIVEDKRGRTLEPVTLSLEFCSQGKTMQKELLSAAALATITSQSFKVTDKTPVISVRRVMGLDESFDLRLLHSKPESWQIDLVKATLTVRDPEGQEFSVVKEVPLSHYQQRNQLIFPFRGTAIVTQGPFNNRGHYGPSNHFAIDVIGLTPTYSPVVAEEDRNESYAGWGREVVAPGDGVVVYARNDVPDNPKPGDSVPSDILEELPDAPFTIPGNFIVIDHGNSEFSVLMHLQAGSVRVKSGDQVHRGETLAKIGNSGDSFAPHLHYQLQSGPGVFRSDPLPVEFENLPNQRLVRGNYFEAK